MSTSMKALPMSDLTPFQEAAAWVAGLAASGAGAMTLWSKIMRSLSSDTTAINNDKTGKQLYELLVSENTRVNQRNKELEERLRQVEIIHAKVMYITNENNSLKSLMKTKNEQLTQLLASSSKERQEASIRFKKYDETILQLNAKVKHLEDAQLSHPLTPGKRIDDHLNAQPLPKLEF